MKQILILVLIFTSNHFYGQTINEELEKEISRRVEQQINPSFSIGILNPDGSTEFYSYGYLGNNEKKPDSLTLYEIGSITKTFTATLADQYLKGLFSDSLSSFFSAINNPALDSITPSDLRNHIGGVPRLSAQFSPKDWSDPFNGYSSKVLRDELRQLKLEAIGQWNYSNLGYSILGQSIENATEKPFEELMNPLLDEVGLENTFLEMPHGYDYSIAKPTNIGTSNANWHFTGPSRYEGGLISCSKDLLSYLKYQKNNNTLFQSNTIDGLIQTGVPNLGEDKLFYKDGWFVLKPNGSTEILLHNGGTGGFISFIGFNKVTNTGVVVLSNSVKAVDDIGLNILYPSFELNHTERTIAYELAENIDAGNKNDLVNQYKRLKSDDFPNNIIDVYWLERFHFGKENYDVSNQLSSIMVQELPDDWEVHDLKGQNLEQLNKYRLAIESYRKALELNPDMTILKEKIERCTTQYKRNSGE